MNNAIVRLGFCLLFCIAGYSASAGIPGVTVTAPAVTNSTTILFDITFTEDVTGFVLADVALTGTAAAGAGTPVFSTIDPKHYTVSVPSLTTNGTLILTVPASVATSVSTSDPNTTGSFTSTFDNVKPGLTVDKNDSPAQDDPTNTTPVVFKFVFSEPINPSTFTSADIKFTGSTATTLSVNATTGIVEIAPMNKTTYLVKVDIAAAFANGTVVVTVNAGDVADVAGNTSNAQTSTDNSVQFNGIKPTVTNLTVNNIDENSAEVGGTITNNGSSAITEHGIYWSTSANVTTASTKVQITGTGSPFDDEITFPAETHIYWRAYAMNGSGTSLASADSEFWTLSPPPNGSSAVPTPGVTITSPTTATITFPAASTQTNAKGYVIIRRKGAEPLTTDAPDGIHPTQFGSTYPASSDSKLVGYVDDATISIDDTGLDPCEHYYWIASLFNWDETNKETTNYRVGGATFNDIDDYTWCSESDIQTLSTTQQLDYASKQGTSIASTGDGLLVYSLRLRDGGTGGDNDLKKTELQSIQISISNPSALRKVALIGGTAVIEQSPSGSITFNIPDNTILANDDGTIDIGIYATFQNTAATIVDQADITFDVTDVQTKVGTNGGGSGLSNNTDGGATPVTHKINVIPTKFVISNVTPLINPGDDFTLTVTAVDGNDLVDTNPANKVRISKTAGTGSLNVNDSGGTDQFLVNGTFTWTQLSFTTATVPGNLKQLKIAHIAGTPSISDAFLDNIVVTSLGTSVAFENIAVPTKGTIVTQTFCFGNTSTTPTTYTTLYPIRVIESDGADFGTGTDLTFTLMLPDGFIFDNTIAPAALGLNAGGDITASATAMTPANSYIGNNIVRVRFNITGTANKDWFTISGLKVKYTKTTAVSNAPITRIGGSAILEKDSDSDIPPVIHAKLSAGNGTAVATFRNQAPVEAEKLSFGRNDAPVVLEGLVDTGGGPIVTTGSSVSFSGDGVVFNGSAWRFNSSTVADGTHDITFTYTDPGAQGCISTSTKTYSVFSSLINGLASTYCRNGTPTALGGPTAPLPSNGTCLLPPFDPEFTAASHYYQYYDPATFTFYPFPDQNNFDPKYAPFIAAVDYPWFYQGSLYVEAYYVSKCNGSMYYAGSITVPYINPPTLNNSDVITDFKYGICSTEPAKDLKATPFLDNGYDEFWATAYNGSATLTGVVTGDRTDGFVFNADAANPGSTDVKIDIHYRHKETGAGGTGCFNEIISTVDVWGKPVAVDINQVFIRSGSGDASAEFCLDEDLTPWSTTSITDVEHKWHYENDAKPAEEGDEFKLTKNSFAAYDANAVANFQLTQILHRAYEFRLNPITLQIQKRLVYAGCEGDELDLSVKIMEPSEVTLDKSGKTCEGVPLLLSTLHPNITSPDVPVVGYWTSTGTGVFKDINGNTVNTYPEALTYEPSNDDYDATKFTLRLESADPLGPCGSDFKEVDISVTPGVTISFPEPQFDKCAAASIPVSVTVDGAAFTWSDLGPGDMDGTTVNKADALFNPTQSQQDLGANNLTLRVTTVDPDGTDGPCLSIHKDITLNVHQRPRISAGSDFSICTDTPHDVNQSMSFQLQASKTFVPSSAIDWSWAITSTGSATPGMIVDPTALVTTYTPSKALGDLTVDNPVRVASSFNRAIVFTITANAPAGNVCDAESSSVTVTIKGTPETPTPISPAPYCLGQSVGFLTTEVPLPKWYTNTASTFISQSKTIAPNITPNVEDVANYWLTQTFDGCESDFAPVVVVVNPVPVANFDFSKYCFGDVTEFVSNSTISPPIAANPVQTRSIVSWEWVFDDGTQTSPGSGTITPGTFKGTTGTFKDPLHVYSETGDFSVKLNVVTSDGCTGTKTKALKVGSIPDPKFTVAKLCDGDDTRFTSSSSLPDDEETTATYTWDFGDSGTSSDTNPVREYAGPGTYTVKLHIKTLLECENEIQKTVSIFPYIKGESSFPYIENFEGNHGWVAEGQVVDGAASQLTSWNMLTSAGSITSDPATAAGPKFWATHTTAVPDQFYYDNERSVVYGPCVDMSELERPVLALDYFNDTELQGDGVYIEYREEDEDGDGTWKRLGANTGGLEWYKGASISGLSLFGGVGQDLGQYGWTGATDGWKTGRYNLDEFVDAERLRFRIVFGSNQSVTTDVYDGFAFDYFKLESRNRLVLVENFTSNSSSSAIASNTTAFKSFPYASASSEVVKIEYHTGLPAATGDPKDPIYTQNPMDPNARAAFYGLSAVPRAYIDGFSDASKGGAFGVTNNVNWSTDYYSTESLKTAPVEIEINKPVVSDGGVLTITGTVTASEMDLLANNYSLYIAVVEKSVTADNTFVLRKMLPTASGTKVPATAKGTSFSFEESWQLDKANLTEDIDDLIAVAFVQSDVANQDNERVILQAAFNDEVPDLKFTTGIETPFLEQTAMYPNPADRSVTIELPQPTVNGVEVSVLDQLGRPVIKSAIGAGQKSVAINTIDLAASVYIVQLKENGVNTARKLVITHSHR